MTIYTVKFTPSSAVLLFLGSGEFNIVVAFQISLNTSLLCGLGVFLLVDRDEISRWCSLAAVLLSVIGILSSSLMLPMLAGIAVVLFLRRGLASTVAHLWLPLTMWGLWNFLFGSTDDSRKGSVSQSVDLFLRLNYETILALAQSLLGGMILAFAVVVGLWHTVALLLRGNRKPITLTPLFLLTAWLAFSVVVAMSRSAAMGIRTDFAQTERYMHVGASLVLPLVALGALYMSRISLALALVPLAALAVGVPGNMAQLMERPGSEAFVLGYPSRNAFMAVAHSDLLPDVPEDLTPFMFNRALTAGWIRTALYEGKVPDEVEVDPTIILNAEMFLVLRFLQSEPTCTPVLGTLSIKAVPGDFIVFDEPVVIVLRDGENQSKPVTFDGKYGRLLVQAGPVDLEITGVEGAVPRVCVGPSPV